MATFSPTITTSSPVTVSTGLTTITYGELVNSIIYGAFQLKVKGVYILANDVSQLSSSWYFTQQSQSGAVKIDPDSYNLSPNQFQPSAFWDFGGKEYTIDNLTTVDIQMNPNSNVQLVFFVDFNTNLDAFAQNTNGGSKILKQQNNFVGNESKKEETPIVKVKDYSDIKKIAVAATAVGVAIFAINKL